MRIEKLEPNSLSSSREFLMGGGILFVVIYHAFCWVYNPIGRFNIGYVGVDIFMFLSGYGLCRSYEKNPITTFYRNRLKRIYPLYFISVCVAHLLMYSLTNWQTFVLNLTTLGYYVGHGLERFDWYLESLFTLYLIFPLLFAFYSRLKYVGLVLMLAIIALACHSFEVAWWYDCLLSRLPIFLYGILFYRYSSVRRSYRACLILGLLLYLPCYALSSRFLAGSLLVLPAVIGLLMLKSNLPGWGVRFVEFCGRHSIEIYCANVLLHRIFEAYDVSVWNRVWMYLVLQVVFSYVLVIVNRRISFMLKHSDGRNAKLKSDC